MQDLEKDILFFYDYLLFLKNIKNEDTYLDYAGVYVAAKKLLLIYGLPESDRPKKFKEDNMLTNYIKLTGMFKVSEFEDAVFELEEIRLVKNQWRLL